MAKLVDLTPARPALVCSSLVSSKILCPLVNASVVTGASTASFIIFFILTPTRPLTLHLTHHETPHTFLCLQNTTGIGFLCSISPTTITLSSSITTSRTSDRGVHTAHTAKMCPAPDEEPQTNGTNGHANGNGVSNGTNGTAHANPEGFQYAISYRVTSAR